MSLGCLIMSFISYFELLSYSQGGATVDLIWQIFKLDGLPDGNPKATCVHSLDQIWDFLLGNFILGSKLIDLCCIYNTT